MNKTSLVALGLAVFTCRITAEAAEFADRIIEYNPGFLPNTLGNYTNSATTLGEPSRTTPGQFGGPVDPFNPPYLDSQIVSIGTNGFLTVQFANPIANDPRNPFGLDFIVFGNTGFVITNGDFSGGGITDGSLFGQNSGLTRVSVSADDVNFFPLIPVHPAAVDGLFPTDGKGDFGRPVDPLLESASFAGQDLAGIRMLYNGSGGGTGFDIGWAVDKENQPVALPNVSFVRIDVLDGHSEIDAFSTVVLPEPGVWAMFVSGAVLLWFGVRLGKHLR